MEKTVRGCCALKKPPDECSLIDCFVKELPPQGQGLVRRKFVFYVVLLFVKSI